MSIELQNIDCNCNNCKFMVRDMDKFKKSESDHYKWQLDYFTLIKNNLLKKARNWHREYNDLEKYESVSKEANSMRFQFDRSTCMINYGNCSKFNKPISFIPNIMQLDTQECFENRKI